MMYKKRTMEEDIKDIGRCEVDPDCLAVKKKMKEMKDKKHYGPEGYWGI